MVFEEVDLALSSTSDWARDVRSPLVLIAQARAQLHEAEGRVADFIIKDPEFVVGSTVSQVAAAAGTSDATVVRFCRSVGLRGFPELRLSLARDMMREGETTGDSEVVSGSESVDKAAYALFSALQRSLSDTMEIQQAAVLERSVSSLSGAALVLVTGEPTHSAVIAEVERRFSSVGLVAQSVVDARNIAASLGRLQSGDVLLALPGRSTSGRYTRMFEVARARGATTMIITSTVAGELEASTDIALHVSPGTVNLGGALLELVVAELALLEALVVGVAVRDLPRTLATLKLVEDSKLEH